MEWDLLVAGAGAAGCALAAKAAECGARVLLLERNAAPGEGRDWIIDMSFDTFDKARVPRPSADEVFSEPAHTFLVTEDRSCMLPLHTSPLVPVRNVPYLAKLKDWAVTSGATVRTGCEARQLILEGGMARGAVVSSGGRDEPVRALVTADCTGIAGTLRMQAPASWGISEELRGEDIVLARRETRRIDTGAARAAQAEGFMTDGFRLDRTAFQGAYSVETCFLDLDRGFVDILVGVKPGSGPTADEHFGAMLDERPYIGEKVFGDGAPIPVRRPLDAFTGEGLVVLGDSACQVIPAHGSGAASAMIAADCCAPAVLNAIRKGRADREALWGYNYDFMTRRGAMLAYYDVVRRQTEAFGAQVVERMIKSGVMGADEVYTGLTLNRPKIGLAVIASKRGAYKVAEILPALAGAGIRGELARRHYMHYPPVHRPGRLEDWKKGMPPRVWPGGGSAR